MWHVVRFWSLSVMQVRKPRVVGDALESVHLSSCINFSMGSWRSLACRMHPLDWEKNRLMSAFVDENWHRVHGICSSFVMQLTSSFFFSRCCSFLSTRMWMIVKVQCQQWHTCDQFLRIYLLTNCDSAETPCFSSQIHYNNLNMNKGLYLRCLLLLIKIRFHAASVLATSMTTWLKTTHKLYEQPAPGCQQLCCTRRRQGATESTYRLRSLHTQLLWFSLTVVSTWNFSEWRHAVRCFND